MPEGVADSTWGPRQGRYRDIMLAGGFDQVEDARFWGCRPPYLPLGSRRDVLVFQSPPLTEDMEVTGPVEVFLWVSSTAVDTDFTAKLIDVYPPSNWYPGGYALKPDRQHSAAAIPQRSRDRRVPAARRGRRDPHRTVPNQQPVRRRPPDPRRHLQLELSALRRQSQHWRAHRAGPSPGRRRQHRLSQPAAAVSHHPAGNLRCVRQARPGPMTEESI